MGFVGTFLGICIAIGLAQLLNEDEEVGFRVVGAVLAAVCIMIAVTLVVSVAQGWVQG